MIDHAGRARAVLQMLRGDGAILAECDIAAIAAYGLAVERETIEKCLITAKKEGLAAHLLNDRWDQGYRQASDNITTAIDSLHE